MRKLPAALSASAQALVNPRLRWVYPAAFLCGVAPICLAWIFGAHRSIPISPSAPAAAFCEPGRLFTGYFSAAQWMIYPLVLPLAIFLLRWMSDALCGTGRASADLPILHLYTTTEARERARVRFRNLALNGRTLLAAAAIALVALVWDTAELAAIYRSYWNPGKITVCPRETDWSVWFTALAPSDPGWISPAKNLLLVFAAYLNQFALMLLGFFVVVLLIAHNVTYLRVIYRRTLARGANPDDFVAVDFDDAAYDRCFGLLSLNKTFNAQLYFLVLAGGIMLFSRFQNVSSAQERSFQLLGRAIAKGDFPAFRSALDFSMFPDFGQSLIGVSWLLAFAVVCLPALLKFLPLLDQKIRQGGLASFLLEFLKPNHPHAVEPMRASVMEDLAWKFARNSFWPTGDRRAHLLFYFAILVFLFLMIPVKPSRGNLLFFLICLAAGFAISVLLTQMFFKTLRFGLSHFDERLVDSGLDSSKVSAGRPSPAQSPTEPRRGLLTLLFTDLIGSTHLKQELGDRDGVRLIQAHHQIVRELLATFPEAQEIKTAGDSFFIVFVRPSEAVKFALQLQNRLRQLPSQAGLKLSDRIGIHIGEVVIEQLEGMAKDFHGTQVDICSRVMSLADGDQILLTRAAFDNARQSLKGERVAHCGDIIWLQHGWYRLKGVEDPLEICEAGERDGAALRAPAASEKAAPLSPQ